MSEPNATRRITEILFNYWNIARGGRLFPARADINEAELDKIGILDDIFIIDVLPLANSNNYRFAYTGKNLANEAGVLSKDRLTKDFIAGLLQNTFDKYNIVAEQKRPLQEEEILKLNGNASAIKYRQILLPLGPEDDGEITSIIGGLRYLIPVGAQV